MVLNASSNIAWQREVARRPRAARAGIAPLQYRLSIIDDVSIAGKTMDGVLLAVKIFRLSGIESPPEFSKDRVSKDRDIGRSLSIYATENVL